MKHTPKGFGTLAIHAGNPEKEAHGALAMPIYQSSTFYFDSCEQGGRRFAGEEGGYSLTHVAWVLAWDPTLPAGWLEPWALPVG